MVIPLIAILGAGNMGASLASGLVKSGHPGNKLWLTDPSEDKLRFLEQTLKVNTSTDNKAAIEPANVVIFAVKPQVFAEVAKPLKEEIDKKHRLIVSIAAGIPIKKIEHWLGKLPIVRTMPNTPALIGCGATALYGNSLVSHEERNVAESILRAVGVTVWLDNEKLIDVVTALSGSGPAYFFHMMEALQLAGEELGLPKEIAKLLTLQTALGSARMALESGKSLTELRQNVTSPGGTTERALSILNEHEVPILYKKAMHAAKLRSEELAEQLGENT